MVVMSTEQKPKPEESVYVSTSKLIADLLKVCQNLQTRVNALQDIATKPVNEADLTNYGRAVICGTIYEIDQDLDSATITIHPSELNERLTYRSETVAGAIATLLDDQGDDGLDYLLGLALAADDLSV
jgi:hypothetical protein